MPCTVVMHLRRCLPNIDSGGMARNQAAILHRGMQALTLSAYGASFLRLGDLRESLACAACLATCSPLTRLPCRQRSMTHTLTCAEPTAPTWSTWTCCNFSQQLSAMQVVSQMRLTGQQVSYCSLPTQAHATWTVSSDMMGSCHKVSWQIRRQKQSACSIASFKTFVTQVVKKYKVVICTHVPCQLQNSLKRMRHVIKTLQNAMTVLSPQLSILRWVAGTEFMQTTLGHPIQSSAQIVLMMPT